MSKILSNLMRKAERWPTPAQAELADIGRQIEAELHAGLYRATPQELVGVDAGLRDASQGKFATDEEVEAVFAKHRRS